MRIYYLDTQDNQAYIYAPAHISDPCIADEAQPLGRNWVTPTFEIVGRDEYRSSLPKTDFPIFVSGTAVLSARAVERLRPLLSQCGEILPIRLSNDPDMLYLFNVTRVINAVDMERSKFMELPSGSIGPCELLIFDSAKIPADALFFKTTQLGPADSIFATEAAVAAVERSGLTGYEFQLAWSNESSLQE